MINIEKINMCTCIIFYKSHQSHGHSNTVGPFSNYLRERMDEGFNVFGLNRFEGGQEADLAYPLKPEAAFSALACLALRAALIFLGCEFGVLGLV